MEHMCLHSNWFLFLSMYWIKNALNFSNLQKVTRPDLEKTKAPFAQTIAPSYPTSRPLNWILKNISNSPKLKNLHVKFSKLVKFKAYLSSKIQSISFICIKVALSTDIFCSYNENENTLRTLVTFTRKEHATRNQN